MGVDGRLARVGTRTIDRCPAHGTESSTVNTTPYQQHAGVLIDN